MTQPAFLYEREGRTSGTAFVLAAIYAVLAWLWYALAVSPVILVLLFLVTVPAIIDLIRNPQSRFQLDGDSLIWRHGRREAEIARAEIRQLHIHLRLDRSIKLIVELETGRKIRVIQPAIPPLLLLEQGLEAQSMPFQKHPFSLL